MPDGREHRLDPDAAVKAFFQDPDWKLKAGVGSMLSAMTLILVTNSKLFLLLLPLTLLFWAAVQGYILRVTRAQIKDPKAVLPLWNDWSEMLFSGLVWMTVISSQIAVLIAVVVVSIFYASVHNCLEAVSPGFVTWSYATLALVAVVLLVISLLLPMLMANFAEKQKIAAVFGAREVARRFFNQPLAFLANWLLSLGIYWLAFLVPLLTVIGIFFLPLTTFVAQVINTIMLAQVWRQADQE